MFFSYKVIDKQGKEIEGRIEARDEQAAVDNLLNRGYSVLSLQAEKESTDIKISFLQRVRTKDMVIFSRQIATLFEADISPLRAFNLVSENVSNKYFQEILRDISKKVEQGFTLEKAFDQHKEVFGEFYIAIIAVGEKSGSLPRSFSYLATYVERNAEIIGRIRKALTYPIFIIIMFVAVVILMLVTVIPQISTILVQSGAELPFITKVVIETSDFFKENIVLILIGMVGGVGGLFYWKRTESGQEAFDNFMVTVPLIGNLFRTFYLVRFSNNLAVMLTNGVSIVSSLQITSRVMGNKVYTRIVEEIEERVRRGVTLSAALESQELISKNVVQIIKIGEETGKTANMLKVIGDFYEKQMSDLIDTLLDLIQPIVIVLLGITVGGLIGSVIVPIYSISGGI